MFSLKKLWVTSMTVFTLATGSLLPVTAAEVPSVYQYVALGDSLTVGYEPGLTESSVPNGFVDRLYEQALFHGRTDLVNLGILGLRTEGLLNYLEAINSQKTLTSEQLQANLLDPRVDRLLKNLDERKKELQQADLITISIGGNDFMPLVTRMVEGKNAPSQDELNEKILHYEENVRDILDLLTTLNPKATIVIADQYQPIPKLYNAAVYEQLDKIRLNLKSVLEKVVDEYNGKHQVKIAYVGESFKNKELAWTYIGRQDIHANQSGYTAMAEQFASAIWGNYQSYDAVDPMTIIVSGQQLDIPYAPKIVDDTLHIPLREYTEALGAVVDWNGAERTVTLTYAGQVTTLQAKDGQVKMFDQKVYLPIRWFSEQLGMDVRYRHLSKTVFINS